MAQQFTHAKFLCLSLDFEREYADNTSMKTLALLLTLSCSLVAQGYTVAYDAILIKDGSAHAMQFASAVTANIRKENRASLAPIVAAIRYAENGGKGREYGILHPNVKPTYRSQAGWCAATVQKHWDRVAKAGGSPHDDIDGFITSLGKRYCPVGAPNDPDGLNQHWIKNVKNLRKRFAWRR